jgi:hypothetical protein
MVPVPTQEGEDGLPPHRKPAQVEDEVHEIHTEIKKKHILVISPYTGRDETNESVKNTAGNFLYMLGIAKVP